MMSESVGIFSGLLLLSGAIFILTGALGLLRLPDFYTRLHAASVTDSLGAWLILLGLAFYSGFTLTSIKLILILLLLVLVSPTASHALAKAALHGKLKPLTIQKLNEESNQSNS